MRFPHSIANWAEEPNSRETSWDYIVYRIVRNICKGSLCATAFDGMDTLLNWIRSTHPVTSIRIYVFNLPQLLDKSKMRTTIKEIIRARPLSTCFSTFAGATDVSATFVMFEIETTSRKTKWFLEYHSNHDIDTCTYIVCTQSSRKQSVRKK